MSERTILVYVDLASTPVFAGRLYMRTLRQRETASFEYDAGWLAHPARFALDPVYLPLSRGAFHAPGGGKLFGGLSDSAPDRWGRTLMGRDRRLAGDHRTLFESDYLLMVHDAARQGALRFKETEGGPFLAASDRPIPPLLELGALLAASDDVQKNEGDAEALRLLLAPGSSLGGARPKASVIDKDGRLAIAKFPASNDAWPVVEWEHIALELAHRSGIEVSDARLVNVGRRRVLITRRFDRRGSERLPYISALAMLGAADADAAHSYLEIADAIRAQGIRVLHNLEQLWRRMIFNVLVSNTDDHLRNHGLLREGSGWILSPAFDLNPMPVDVKPRVHALAFDDTNRDASLDTVMRVGEYFGIDEIRCLEIAAKVARVTANWRRAARAHGLTAASIDRMATAFEHADAHEARRIARRKR